MMDKGHIVEGEIDVVGRVRLVIIIERMGVLCLLVEIGLLLGLATVEVL